MQFDASDTESDSESEAENEAQAAAANFSDLLLSLLFAGKISAKTLCVICWWCWKAGLEAAKPLAFRPDAPSGHYQRHIDTVLGIRMNNSVHYKVSVPRYAKYNMSRAIQQIPVNCPHEVLGEEVDANPGIIAEAGAGSADRWSQIYR